jgi:hypothetical protein
VPARTPSANPSGADFDVVPTLFVVETSSDQLSDERTALASPHPPVEFGDESIVERYVQSHVPRIRHRLRSEDGAGGNSRTTARVPNSEDRVAAVDDERVAGVELDPGIGQIDGGGAELGDRWP